MTDKLLRRRQNVLGFVCWQVHSSRCAYGLYNVAVFLSEAELPTALVRFVFPKTTGFEKVIIYTSLHETSYVIRLSCLNCQHGLYNVAALR